MKRVFLNYPGQVRCGNACGYCFADWATDNSDYDTLGDYGEKVVIYPLCNNDITSAHDTEDIKNYLEDCLTRQSRFAIISLSTKSGVSTQFLDWVAAINERYAGKGFIKLSISFSCKSLADTVEPKALPYNARLFLLKNITQRHIPASVILKPILPFVETDEYYEIIDDVSAYVDALVVGGLYVNQDTQFYKNYIANKYTLDKKNVSWLRNHPLWFVVNSQEKIEDIKKYCVQKQKYVKCYTSDVEHLEALAGKYQNG